MPNSVDFEQQFRSLIEKEISDKKEKKLVFCALELAKKCHLNQKRQSGEDYIIHPLTIALNLHKKYGDLTLTIAALLHDAVEDCPKLKMEKIYAKFGKEVGFLVDSSTKTILRYHNRNKILKDKIEKILLGGIKDIRAIILKLADRKFNLSDLGNLLPNKQVRMSFETQAIYFPLRKIMKLDETDSILAMKENFKKFLEKKKIRNERELKKYLFNICFNNLTGRVYDIVYGNSDKIIWLIEDRKFYARLCENKDFEKAVDSVNSWTDGENFKAMMTFKKGAVFNDKKIKFSLLNYKI